MTENDKRVLRNIEIAQREWDGYAPHGSSDWLAVRRLRAAGWVDEVGWGTCADCDCSEPHEGPIFALTKEGRMAQEAIKASETKR